MIEDIAMEAKVRPIKPQQDLDQIQMLFKELYSFENFWKPVLFRGTFRLFWKEISLSTAVVIAFEVAFLGEFRILPTLSTLILIFCVVVFFGIRKCFTLLNRFQNAKDHFGSRLEAGDTFLVAEIDDTVVGTLGIQWEPKVNPIQMDWLFNR